MDWQCLVLAECLPRSGSSPGGQLLVHNVPHHHTVPPTLNSDHSELFLSLECQALSPQTFAVPLAWDPPRAASDSSGLT